MYLPSIYRRQGQLKKKSILSVGKQKLKCKCRRCGGITYNRQTCKAAIPLHAYEILYDFIYVNLYLFCVLVSIISD